MQNIAKTFKMSIQNSPEKKQQKHFFSVATCPVPVSPDGGSVSVQTDGAVTTARYQCAEDYSLYGAEVRTCLTDNTWEYDMPACSKYPVAMIVVQYMSRPMGKPTICIGENKGADQLRGNREADQRLCFRYSDSTIPPLLNSKISSF